MRLRYRVTVFVVSAGAALLSPVVSRAAHPPVLPGSAAETAHSGTKEYQFTTLDAPGALYTAAYGINTPGLVAGSYFVNGWHGALWQNGSLTTVAYPGVRHTLLGEVAVGRARIACRRLQTANDLALLIGFHGAPRCLSAYAPVAFRRRPFLQPRLNNLVSDPGLWGLEYPSQGGRRRPDRQGRGRVQTSREIMTRSTMRI